MNALPREVNPPSEVFRSRNSRNSRMYRSSSSSSSSSKSARRVHALCHLPFAICHFGRNLRAGLILRGIGAAKTPRHSTFATPPHDYSFCFRRRDKGPPSAFQRFSISAFQLIPCVIHAAFPRMDETEQPDRMASHLARGRRFTAFRLNFRFQRQAAFGKKSLRGLRFLLFSSFSLSAFRHFP